MGTKNSKYLVDLRDLNIGMDNSGNITLGVELDDHTIDPKRCIDFTGQFNAMLEFMMQVHTARRAAEIQKAKTEPKIYGIDGNILN